MEQFMPRIKKFPALILAAGILGACESTPESVTTVTPPTAGVRFIHAVPDTGLVDMRFVDIPENSSHFAIPFRNNISTSAGIPASTMIQYKNTDAGFPRHLKIFLNSSDQTIAQTVLKDTVVNLVAGRNYTFLLWGYANPAGPGRPAGAPAMEFRVIEETVADPSPSVALRVMNTSITNVDVRHYPDGGTVPPTSPAEFTNVPGMTFSSYLNTSPGLVRFNVRNAGTATNLIATDALALRGDTALTMPPGPMDAVPGTRVAGSALSAIVFPAAVAGTAAASVANSTAPAISFVWDRRPPRPPGT
jgi:hypothetical protein